jgi:hypothetical protein
MNTLTDQKPEYPSEYLNADWWTEDIKQYNIAVRGLPMITTSNASPEVIQHIAFLGEEVVRLRDITRKLSAMIAIPNGEKK